jgi:hypothetical protein
MQKVAVLFARRDSIYKNLRGVDVWDADRDAMNWPGGCPVVAHPPCRAWGRLRLFAAPDEGERELALWAVDQVREWGGVLEHPRCSLLWPAMDLPKPGHWDKHGGWTLQVHQHWWGHRAEKATWLYVCGGPRAKDLPPVPFVNTRPPRVVNSRKRHGDLRKHITKPEREHTPVEFAKWLVAVARKCGRTT